MNQIKEIFTKINEKRAEASIDLDTINPKNRAGVSGLVRAATRDLPALEQAYSQEVLRSAKILAITGNKQDELANMARGANLLVVDFNGAEAEILANVRARLLPGKEDETVFDSNLNFIFIDELMRFRSKYEIMNMAEPVKHDKNAVLGKNYAAAISTILDQNYGNSLRSAYTRIQIAKGALAKATITEVVPVVMINAQGNVDTQFLPNPVMTAEISSDFSSEQIQTVASDFVKMLAPKQTNKGQSARKTKEI
jgi:hypothetical protein